MDEQTQPKNNLAIPGAIIVAGLFIAGAIFMTNGGITSANPTLDGGGHVAGDNMQAPQAEQLREGDHILGDPNAPIVIVEYSDTECPFCKRFHETMNQVMAEYGDSGDVAWVYRHFPLDSIHSKARKEAEATECAAELGGENGFWNYVNTVFEITPANNGLDLAVLPDIAEQIGLDREEFQTCLDSGKYAEKVEADFQLGIAQGVQGTPHSIGIVKDGEPFIIPGAQPFASVKQGIDKILNAQ